MKRFLYPTDLSEDSDLALQYVIWMGSKLGGELHVLHVIERPQLCVVGGSKPTGSLKGRDYEGEMQVAARRLETICESCFEERISCVSHVSVGDPAKEILKYIEKEKIDVVFLAPHREKGHSQFGGVSAKIVKKTTAMVVTIPCHIKKP